MRTRATLLTAALASALAFTGCGHRTSPDSTSASGGAASASPGSESPAPAHTEIPDDFPLSDGMGGPEDTIATARTGTGLRDLGLCGTTPLRGLSTRDRMVADNSGGEAANTRELVLLGSPDEAALVARAFADLPATCGASSGDAETVTDVRESPFGPAPASTLVQTYTFDGQPGDGATVIHVVPVGAALLVTSTYGQWTQGGLEDGVQETADAVRPTVAALSAFDDVPTPTIEPTLTDGSSPSAVFQVTWVGSARLMVSTYGEGSLTSLGQQADQVTGTTATIVPAMCAFTRTGC